jgi:hypothetical protein
VSWSEPLGEERIADNRVLDEVEHVGGVAPEIGPPSRPQLRAQAGPGGAAVGTVTGRVGCLEQRARGHAHCVVNDQALGAELDKRERAQGAEQFGRIVVRQHRLQQAERRTADDRSGVEGAAGHRIEPIDVQARQFLDHRPQHGILRGQPRPFG